MTQTEYDQILDNALNHLLVLKSKLRNAKRRYARWCKRVCDTSITTERWVEKTLAAERLVNQLSRELFSLNLRLKYIVLAGI